jgi:hypothetical protein
MPSLSKHSFVPEWMKDFLLIYERRRVMSEKIRIKVEVSPCLLVPDALPALARLRTGLK